MGKDDNTTKTEPLVPEEDLEFFDAQEEIEGLEINGALDDIKQKQNIPDSQSDPMLDSTLPTP